MNPLLNQIQEMGMQISALTVQNARLSVMLCYTNIGIFTLLFSWAFFEWATSEPKPEKPKNPQDDPLFVMNSRLNAAISEQNKTKREQAKEIETLRSSMMGHKVLLEKAIQEQNAAAFSYVNGLGDGINERILDVQKRILENEKDIKDNFDIVKTHANFISAFSHRNIEVDEKLLKSEELHTAHSHRYVEMGKRFDKIEQLVEFDGKRITNDYMEVTGEIGKVSRNLRVLDRRTLHLKKKKTPTDSEYLKLNGTDKFVNELKFSKDFIVVKEGEPIVADLEHPTQGNYKAEIKTAEDGSSYLALSKKNEPIFNKIKEQIKPLEKK